jgi:hypothetical protein
MATLTACEPTGLRFEFSSDIPRRDLKKGNIPAFLVINAFRLSHLTMTQQR